MNLRCLLLHRFMNFLFLTLFLFFLLSRTLYMAKTKNQSMNNEVKNNKLFLTLNGYFDSFLNWDIDFCFFLLVFELKLENDLVLKSESIESKRPSQYFIERHDFNNFFYWIEKDFKEFLWKFDVPSCCLF